LLPFSFIVIILLSHFRYLLSSMALESSNNC